MPQSSPRVSLPYLQPSQAQKHITHNEALQRLDMVTQLTVRDFAEVTPPALPAAGDMYGVGSGATGAWAGQDGALAYWDGTGWLFVTPQDGWRAWGLNTQALRVWRDGSWQEAVTQLQNLEMLGIGGAADTTNRLVLHADGALLSHAGADHRLILNKATDTDTAAVLFQSNWTGHAEMGLAGDTAFALKIRADGTSWDTVLQADPVTQNITLAPAGTPRMVLGDSGLSLDVPMTGTAVQSRATDTTMGRLMTVGGFGTGIAITLTSGDNLNDMLTSGEYYNPTGGNTAGNNYPISRAGALHVISRSTTNVVQRFSAYGGDSSSGSVRVFERSWGTLGWTPWVELYHQGSVLGPVSQAGGVPTGAVIERGSNANGDYVRFADGTQMCWTGPATASANPTSWTFPAVFSVAPNVQATATDNFARIVVADTIMATGADFYVYSDTAGTSTTVHAAMAIGRWY